MKNLKAAVQQLYRPDKAEHSARVRVLPAPAPLPTFILGGGTLHALYARRSFSRYKKAFALLDAALEAGCSAFDVAAVYGNGATEKIIGRFMKSRDLRQRIVLIGKGGHPHVAGVSRLDQTSLSADLDASLGRLGTDVIDMYMLHRDDPALPVGMIMETLHRFVQAGKVLAIGASNWTHTRIEAANLYARAHGLSMFEASSPQLSLVGFAQPPWPGCVSIAGDQHAAARAWYAATHMPVLAWSPLAAGYLSGKANLDAAQVMAYDSPANRLRRDRLEQLARKRGMPAAHLALAYIRQLGLTVHPIIYTAHVDRLKMLFQSQALRLTADEVQWLEHLTPTDHS